VRRFARVAALGLLVLGLGACSGGSGASAAGAKAACRSLAESEDRRDLSDDGGYLEQLRRAERQAAGAGAGDLADHLGAAVELMDDLAAFRRPDGLDPEYLALVARLEGNLSFAEADCAEAGYPTALR
jgi:hypothetical protein